MILANLLTEKKSAILKKWFNLILATYPEDTQKFLRSQKDRFANPVGSNILQGLEGLFEELLHEQNPERISQFLDHVIRVRAVQDFSPSQAVSFILKLKKVIREELGKAIGGKGLFEELLAFESRIDEMALLSFDLFMKCREKIYEIRANELRNRTGRLLERFHKTLDNRDRDSEREDNQNDGLN